MPQYTEYHGNQGLILVSKGTLNTDYYGLDSATAIWKCPMDKLNLIPNMLSQHPVWTWLSMEKRQVEHTPGYLIITGEYCGITGGSTPSVYELNYAGAEEPIETHPKFTSEIAGKPSSPLNGAVFIDPKTGAVSTDDATAVFDKFRTNVAGARNPFAGIMSYLSPEATIREVWLSTSPVSGANLGRISAPGFSVAIAGGNWLFTGISFQQRGRIYQNTREWRGSGRNGWNSTIYS